MDRAYSLLEIKSFDEDARTFEGIASTPSLDLGGDSLDPMGAQFKLPMPLLWQHGKGDIKDPIGWITEASPNKDGIPVKGRFAKVDTPQSLKNDLDRVWALVKAGLVRGLSVGWKPIEGKPYGDGYRYSKWGWHELSAVAIAMNTEASITLIKSIDMESCAASGAQGSPVRLDLPGATGTQRTASAVFLRPEQGKDMKTTAEQIASFEAKRQASAGRMDAIMAKSAEEGRSLDETEAQEYETLTAEVKAVDEHIVRLKAHEQVMIKNAVAVKAPAGDDDQQAAGTNARKGVIVMGDANLPKGTAFTRYAMALLASKGDSFKALSIAEQWKDSTPEVAMMIREPGIFGKAAVAAGTTTTSGWASQLVVAQNMASEFIDLLRPMTILGRMTGIRRVPFNITIPRATAGTTAGWVGQGNPKPVSRMTFDQVALTYHKIATIVVLTEELVRLSNPAAEAIVRQDMLAAVAQFTDQQFIDPTIAASGTTSPASITYGATSHSMTGSTIANITTDVSTLFADFSTANDNDLSSGVFVMHPRTARYLSMLRTTQDVFAFPGITQNGGVFFGIPVLTSNSVPIDTGTDTYIFLINASDILLADDGGIEIDVSREASIVMDSGPSNPATSTVSLWQSNLVGLRAERFITWARRRASAVSILEDVSY